MSIWRSPEQKAAVIAEAERRMKIFENPPKPLSARTSSATAAAESAKAVPDSGQAGFGTLRGKDDIEPPDAYVGREKALHIEFARDMARRGVHLVHARTDVQSTIEIGTPDFHCMFTADLSGWTGGPLTRGCAVEFKTAGKKLRESQREKITEMRRLGIPVAVCYTLHDAISFCREHLGC